MITPKLGKGLGRRRDYYDPRDHDKILKLDHPLVTSVLPSSADVFVNANPAVRDQLSLGGCTAFATCTHREWLALKFAKYSIPYQELSPLYQYYQERVIDGDVSQDDGSTTRTSCTVACTVGFMPESEFPYDPANFAEASLAITPGQLRQQMAWHRIIDLTTMKAVLASGYAFIIGMTVYGGIEDVTGPDFLMPMPSDGEQPIGGHELVIFSYDDSKQAFQLRNSWGETYGDSGNFWVPYQFIQNFNISQFDAAVMHLGNPWK